MSRLNNDINYLLAFECEDVNAGNVGPVAKVDSLLEFASEDDHASGAQRAAMAQPSSIFDITPYDTAIELEDTLSFALAPAPAIEIRLAMSLLHPAPPPAWTGSEAPLPLASLATDDLVAVVESWPAPPQKPHMQRSRRYLPLYSSVCAFGRALRERTRSCKDRVRMGTGGAIIACAQCALRSHRTFSGALRSGVQQCLEWYSAIRSLEKSVRSSIGSMCGILYGLQRRTTRAVVRAASAAQQAIVQSASAAQRAVIQSVLAGERAVLRSASATWRAIVESASAAWYAMRACRLPAVWQFRIRGHDFGRSVALFSFGVAVTAFVMFLMTPTVPGTSTVAVQPSLARPAHAIEAQPSLSTLKRSEPLDATSTRPAISVLTPVSGPISTVATRDARSTALDPNRPSLKTALASPTPRRERLVGTVGVRARDLSARIARAKASSERPAGVPASPFLGSLAVNSSPAGAQVFVNGVAAGATPLLLRDVPAGSRVVRVELEGHQRWSSAVRVVANQQTLAKAELRPVANVR